GLIFSCSAWIMLLVSKCVCQAIWVILNNYESHCAYQGAHWLCHRTRGSYWGSRIRCFYSHRIFAPQRVALLAGVWRSGSALLAYRTIFSAETCAIVNRGKICRRRPADLSQKSQVLGYHIGL